jgi:hypothetical protein
MRNYDLNNIEDLLTIVFNKGNAKHPLSKDVVSNIQKVVDYFVDFIVYSLKFRGLDQADIPNCNFTFEMYLNYLACLNNYLPQPIDIQTTEKMQKKPFKHGKVRVTYPEMFLLLVSHDYRHDSPDMIVSFNYDLLLERIALNSRKVGGENVYYIYYPQFKTKVGEGHVPVPIIKPNGSANWLYCRDCEMVMVYDDYVFSKTECKNCSGKNTIPSIIPPGEKDYKRRIGNISIAELVMKAKNIGLLGYSLPMTDRYVFSEFERGLQLSEMIPKIHIFNPDKNLKERENSYFKELYSYKTVKNYITWNPLSLGSMDWSSYKAENLFGEGNLQLISRIGRLFDKEI